MTGFLVFGTGQEVAQVDRLAPGVRQFDADGISSRHHGDPAGGDGHGACDVVGEGYHARRFHAGGGDQFVEGDHRPGSDLVDLSPDAELGQDPFEELGVLAQGRLVELGRAGWRAGEHGQIGKNEALAPGEFQDPLGLPGLPSRFPRGLRRTDGDRRAALLGTEGREPVRADPVREVWLGRQVCLPGTAPCAPHRRRGFGLWFGREGRAHRRGQGAAAHPGDQPGQGAPDIEPGQGQGVGEPPEPEASQQGCGQAPAKRHTRLAQGATAEAQETVARQSPQAPGQGPGRRRPGPGQKGRDTAQGQDPTKRPKAQAEPAGVGVRSGQPREAEHHHEQGDQGRRQAQGLEQEVRKDRAGASQDIPRNGARRGIEARVHCLPGDERRRQGRPRKGDESAARPGREGMRPDRAGDLEPSV